MHKKKALFKVLNEDRRFGVHRFEGAAQVIKKGPKPVVAWFKYGDHPALVNGEPMSIGDAAKALGLTQGACFMKRKYVEFSDGVFVFSDGRVWKAARIAEVESIIDRLRERLQEAQHAKEMRRHRGYKGKEGRRGNGEYNRSFRNINEKLAEYRDAQRECYKWQKKQDQLRFGSMVQHLNERAA